MVWILVYCTHWDFFHSVLDRILCVCVCGDSMYVVLGLYNVIQMGLVLGLYNVIQMGLVLGLYNALQTGRSPRFI